MSRLPVCAWGHWVMQGGDGPVSEAEDWKAEVCSGLTQSWNYGAEGQTYREGFHQRPSSVLSKGI